MTSSIDRFRELNALTTCNDPDPYHADDAADLNAYALRDLLLDINDDNAHDAPDFDTMRDHLLALHEHAALPHDESARQSLSLLALDNSLCPMHMIDYAICFDDDDPDCAMIRAFFPSHDT